MLPSQTDRPVFEVRKGPLPVGLPLECAADEAVVFVQDGRLMGTLGPGRYTLAPDAVPFLASAVRSDPSGLPVLALDALVLRLEGGAFTAAGSAGQIVDQLTSLRVQVDATIRAPMRVVDANRAGFGLFTMGDPASVNQWIADMMLSTLREHVRSVREPLHAGDLMASSLATTAPAAVQSALVGFLDQYGLAPTEPPLVQLSIAPADQEHWQRAAEPLLAQQTAQLLGAAGGHASCPRCGAAVSGGSFCTSCGAPLNQA